MLSNKSFFSPPSKSPSQDKKYHSAHHQLFWITAPVVCSVLSQSLKMLNLTRLLWREEWKCFLCNGVFAQCYLPILTNLSHLDRLYWPGWVCRKGQARTTPHLRPIQDTKYQGYVIGYCDCEGVSLFLNFELCLNLFKSTNARISMMLTEKRVCETVRSVPYKKSWPNTNVIGPLSCGLSW